MGKNAQKRKAAKAAKRGTNGPGPSGMEPTIKNLTRIMKKGR